MDRRSVVIIALQIVAVVRSQYGILKADNGSATKSFCVYIFPKSLPLPQSKNAAVPSPFLDLNSTWNGCGTDKPPESLAGKVVAMNILNCSILEKAKTVERQGGAGIIIVSSKAPTTKSNDSYSEINITVTAIGDTSAALLSKMGDNVKVIQYVEEESGVDYSLLLIWALAMITLSIGSFWSGHVKYYLSLRKKHVLSGATVVTDTTKSASSEHEEEDSLRLTPWLVLIFVSCMSVMLVMLYFFYDYLVYVIIAMFCLASALGLYQCFEPILPKIPCANGRVRRLRILCLTCRPQPKQVLLALMCISVPIWWVIIRKESYAWIIQDILGVAFSINMLKIMRLPNLKICTVLMALLFIYDIFFVFVTPFFTKNGESVMVEVATGGSSQEQLPMVLKVPHFGNNPLAVCNDNTRYSLLGFGDILVPGLLISYCLSFDLEVKSGKIYFISTVIAYGIGLVMTFGALYVMTAAQPALLYLVPCTLLTVFVIAACRKETRKMWDGSCTEPDDERRSSGDDGTSRVVDNAVKRGQTDGSDTASDTGEGSALVR